MSHQPDPIKGWRGGSGGTWPPGIRRQVHLGHDVEASQVREATQEGMVPTLSLSIPPQGHQEWEGTLESLGKGEGS